MRKLVLVAFVVFIAIFQAKSQPVVLAFTINHSQNFNAGGWFCDLDSITIQDYSTGMGNHWTIYLQDFNYNNIDTIEYFSYQPEVAFAVPHYNTHYRIDFNLHYEDSVGGDIYGAGANIDFRMSYSDNLYLNHQVQIPIGDSVVTLAVCSGNGLANFTWYKNGNQLKQDMEVYCSQLLASDTGSYVINYSPFGCSVQDTILVVYGCQLTLNQYNAEITPDDPTTFIATASSPGNFYWILYNDTVAVTINDTSSTFIASQVGEYLISYINPGGCSAESYVFVDWVWPGSVCAMFGTDDSLSLGGGYFCNQDSITFYDMSYLYSNAPLYHWVWRIKTGDDVTVLKEIIFDQSNYEPSITIGFPDSTAIYRIELAVSSYAPGTSTVNVGIHLRFADVVASNDTIISVGDSVTLNALTHHGPGNFIWYKNGNCIYSTLDSYSSQIVVADSGFYSVHYYNNGCEAWDSVKVSFPDVTTGLLIFTPPSREISVYPNPSFDQFTVENFSGKLEIFSATGQLILSQEISETTDFICADWQPGFYFIRFNSAGKTKTVKLVKN